MEDRTPVSMSQYLLSEGEGRGHSRNGVWPKETSGGEWMMGTGGGGDRSRIGHSHLLPHTIFPCYPQKTMSFLRTGLCPVLACVLRCLRLMLVSWLQQRVENNWFAPTGSPGLGRGNSAPGYRGHLHLLDVFPLKILSAPALPSTLSIRSLSCVHQRTLISLPFFWSGQCPDCLCPQSSLVSSLLPASSRRPSVLNSPGIILTLHVATVPARVGQSGTGPRPACHSLHLYLDPWRVPHPAHHKHPSGSREIKSCSCSQNSCCDKDSLPGALYSL